LVRGGIAFAEPSHRRAPDLRQSQTPIFFFHSAISKLLVGKRNQHRGAEPGGVGPAVLAPRS
jgi:hypothetical protein